MTDAPKRHADEKRNLILNRTLTDLDHIINDHDPEVHTSINNGVWDRLDKMAVQIEERERTHSDALVAAAYEDAAKVCDREWAAEQKSVETRMYPTRANADWIADEIRQSTPADAQAAYDAAITQARREGWEAAKTEAAGLADALSVEMELYMALPTTTTKSKALCIRNRIQALEYKESA